MITIKDAQQTSRWVRFVLRRISRLGRRRWPNPSAVLTALSPEEHHTSVVIPEVHQSGVAALVCELVIVDHGTGVGATLADLLGLDELAVADVTDGWSVVAGKRLAFALHQVESETDHVGVAPFDSDIRTHVARSEVADHILTLLTRSVLDTQIKLSHLHGGAVAAPDGQAVLILGSSGAGKSTLTAHLAAADGWRLITDEQIALLSDQELVGGFTRPVAIKRAGFAYVPPPVPLTDEPSNVRLLTANLLGCGRALAASPALIVLPERDDHVNEVTWELLEPAAAVMELCANNLDMVRRPAETLQAFGWLASTSPTVRFRYRDSAAGAQAVRGLIEDPLPAISVSYFMPQINETCPTKDGNAGADDSEAGVGPHVSALQVGTQLILFNQLTRELLRLDAEAARLWTALATRGTLGEGLDDCPGQDVVDLVENLMDRGFLDPDRCALPTGYSGTGS